MRKVFQKQITSDIYFGCEVIWSSLVWKNSSVEYLKKLESFSLCQLVIVDKLSAHRFYRTGKILQTCIRPCHLRFVSNIMKTTFDNFQIFKPIIYIPCLQKFQNSVSTCIKIPRTILCRKRNLTMKTVFMLKKKTSYYSWLNFIDIDENNDNLWQNFEQKGETCALIWYLRNEECPFDMVRFNRCF